MASAMVKGGGSRLIKSVSAALGTRFYAKVATGTDIVSAAPNVSLQKARTWDEGIASKFSTTPLKDIFKDKKVVIFGLPGAYTGVCSNKHVPPYKENIDKFKAKGIDSVICVAVNDPYTMNAWAEKLQAKEAIDFYGDFDGSFHKSLDLVTDLSGALLGTRSERWSAYVVDGKIKALNVEEAPSDVKVSGADTILGQI
ncbi:peroxiredoxin-2F, mitochondrial isoform X1 [Cajanus cajan]|uniref:Glutaredoxin-dependent peroxiredoxin n=1 Tax=Cajanus cajan TaxID=3821 RepID=A0A151U0R3_CAJCA|nr:peroxiredoxin-2F, mitochondrial isoform X1 [Cajanus cajan]KYP72851.1 hypothetical protein KK1_005454 [Cajanus cajan]